MNDAERVRYKSFLKLWIDDLCTKGDTLISFEGDQKGIYLQVVSLRARLRAEIELVNKELGIETNNRKLET